jgi:methionine-rich copper-binding protein CopC
MLFLLSAGVSAHSKLIATSPADEEQVSEPPEQLTLEFNRDVRLLKVELIPGGGDAVDIDFKPMMKKDTTFAVVLPELEEADYLVTWIAMGGDSHKMKGKFSFSLEHNE